MSDGHPRTEAPTYIHDGYTDNKGDHAAANSEHLAHQDASDAIFVVVMVRPVLLSHLKLHVRSSVTLISYVNI
jgi:hypothetical protein